MQKKSSNSKIILNNSNKNEAKNIILKCKQEFGMVVHPNFINKFSLYLTGRVQKGVEIIGVGPMAMRAYWSMLDYTKNCWTSDRKQVSCFY